MTAMDQSTPPTVFVSYSWDDDDHLRWAQRLADDLRANGVDAFIDQHHARPGSDIVRYMEEKIASVDAVVIICTPNYKEKADRRKGGVGYEAHLAAFSRVNNDPKRLFPVLRRGTRQDSIPRYAQNLVYIDFSRDDDYKKRLRDLLTEIHVLHAIPSIGPRPIGEAFDPKLSDQPSHRSEGVEHATERRSPVVLVADIVDSSLLQATSRIAAINTCWKHAQDRFQEGITSGAVHICGTADQVLLGLGPAANDTSYDEILEFCVEWVNAVSTGVRGVDVRVAVSVGDFDAHSLSAPVSEVLHGLAVSNALRLVRVPEGSSIVAEEKFIDAWAHATQLPISKSFVPSLRDPLETHNRRNAAPQRFRFVSKDGLKDQMPRSLQAINAADTALQRCMEELLLAFWTSLHQRCAGLKKTPGKGQVRASFFVPDPAVEGLIATQFRVQSGTNGAVLGSTPGEVVYPWDSDKWPVSAAFFEARASALFVRPLSMDVDSPKYAAKLSDRSGLDPATISNMRRRALCFVGIPVRIADLSIGAVCVDILTFGPGTPHHRTVVAVAQQCEREFGERIGSLFLVRGDL